MTIFISQGALWEPGVFGQGKKLLRLLQYHFFTFWVDSSLKDCCQSLPSFVRIGNIVAVLVSHEVDKIHTNCNTVIILISPQTGQDTDGKLKTEIG